MKIFKQIFKGTTAALSFTLLSATNVALPLASKNTDLDAGIVQKIVFVPALKLTALSLFELLIIVVLAIVLESLFNVHKPTSNSAVPGKVTA